MDNKCVEKLLETVAFSNGCICSVELIRWEHTHFHPSGSLEPSRDDIAITNRMQQLCMMAGIPVVDHIILGQNDFYYSFREKDVLPMDDIRYSTDLSDVDLKVAEKEAEKYGYKKTETAKSKKSIRVSLAEKKKLTQESVHKTSGINKSKGPEL